MATIARITSNVYSKRFDLAAAAINFPLTVAEAVAPFAEMTFKRILFAPSAKLTLEEISPDFVATFNFPRFFPFR